jgi:type IV secretory pathway VirB10-like protein
MAINLKGRLPRITSAMSPRLVYIGAALAVIGILFVAYGFRYRMKKKEEQRAVFSLQNAAPEAAVSNRKGLHGLTPVSTLQEEPSPALQIGKAADNAAHNITAPLGANRDAQPGYISPAVPMTPPEDPAVTMRADRARREYERRMAAIDAPTGQGGGGGTDSPASPKTTDPLADLTKLAAMAGNPASPAQNASHRREGLGTDDPNGQEEKREFQQAAEGDYLKTTRVAPLSPWVVERGEVIPAGLPSQIMSDLPGDVVAELKRDVYDSPQHRYVLIPAGSLLAGEYNSAVTYGQKRAQVIWTYLRFPDGSYVDLDKFVSHSADGAAGLGDQVDNHIKRLLGGVALTSAFAAGIQISQNRTGGNSTLSYPSNTQLAASAAGQQAAQLGEQITTRNLNVQPTIKIRPGDVFYVSVMKTIIFPGPYKPLNFGARKVLAQ